MIRWSRWRTKRLAVHSTYAFPPVIPFMGEESREPDQSQPFGLALCELCQVTRGWEHSALSLKEPAIREA